MRKPNGWKGVIETGAGTLAIEPWETLEFENAGIYLYHNDKYDTTTFLPIFTVREVRWHNAEKEREGSNVGGQAWTKNWHKVGEGLSEYHERMQELQRERKELDAPSADTSS